MPLRWPRKLSADALGGEQRARVAGDARDHAAGVDAAAIADHDLELRCRDRASRTRLRRAARRRSMPGLRAAMTPRRARAGGDRRFGRDVAAEAEVLGERCGDRASTTELGKAQLGRSRSLIGRLRPATASALGCHGAVRDADVVDVVEREEGACRKRRARRRDSRCGSGAPRLSSRSRAPLAMKRAASAMLASTRVAARLPLDAAQRCKRLS